MSEKYRKGEYTNCRYDICEIVDSDGDVFCTVAMEDVDLVIGVLNENDGLKQELNNCKDANVRCCNEYSYFHKQMMKLEKENEQLKKENERMTDKLNELALEFLNYNMVTMGKATEMSEMCYYDFLKYRKEHENPMELQL